MKKLLSAILLTATLSLSTLAWGSRQQLTIRAGEQKAADGGRVTVSFTKVIDDSRCPMNARCVWAGNARIELAISKGKGQAQIVELNTNTGQRIVRVFGYRIRLDGLTQKNPESMEMVDRPLVATISITK